MHICWNSKIIDCAIGASAAAVLINSDGRVPVERKGAMRTSVGVPKRIESVARMLHEIESNLGGDKGVASQSRWGNFSNFSNQ